jgi:hypothetical protein
MAKKDLKQHNIHINHNDIQNSLSWLEVQDQNQLPESLVRLLRWLPDLLKDYENKKRSVTKLLSELARSFHKIPSSEKTANIVSETEEEKRKAEQNDAQKINETLCKIKRLKKYLSRIEKNVVKKLQNLPKEELFTEQPKEANSTEPRKETAEKNKKKKDEAVEAILSSPQTVQVDQQPQVIHPEEEEVLAKEKGILKQEQTRQKNDFIFMRNDTTLKFNTYFDPKTGHKFSPDLSLIGPENYNVTWRGIVNSISLVMGMAMPISRVEKLFGEEGFSRSNIIRYMDYCARVVSPVYLYFGEQLAQVEVIEADDTNTRIHELTRYFRKLKSFEQTKDPEQTTLTAPWQTQKENSLFSEINSNWQFVS